MRCATKWVRRSGTARKAQDLCQDFAAQPLRKLQLDLYIDEMPSCQLGDPLVNRSLPFDVSTHNQAKSVVALSMIKRLKDDMEEFADSKNNCKVPKLIGISQKLCKSIMGDESQGSYTMTREAKITLTSKCYSITMSIHLF